MHGFNLTMYQCDGLVVACVRLRIEEEEEWGGVGRRGEEGWSVRLGFRGKVIIDALRGCIVNTILLREDRWRIDSE